MHKKGKKVINRKTTRRKAIRVSLKIIKVWSNSLGLVTIS